MYQTAIQAPEFEHRFAAELLNARSCELAACAAKVLLEAHPELAERYRPQPHAKWVVHFLGEVADLAAALASARPDVFDAQVAWTKVAFAARGVPLDDLEHSLKALRRVVLPALPPEEAPLVESYLDQALTRMGAAPTLLPSKLSMASEHGRLAAEYLLKLLEGDRGEASRLVLDAARNGVPVRTIYREVLLPVQEELGRMWHVGDISIAEEHFATATAQIVMSRLGAFADRKPFDGRVVVAASVEGNSHDLGARCVADFFEMAGWRAVYLGSSVPAPDLAAAARDFGAHLVALSAALSTHLQVAEDSIRAVRQEVPEARIIVGGGAFFGLADLWRVYGADGYAETADRAVEIGDELVTPRGGVRAMR